MAKAKVISAFPCCGKSYFSSNHMDIYTIDLDSSFYSWTDHNGTKIRNPDFPDNYIQEIKRLSDNYSFIFVSSHISVRTALSDNKIPYILVYPLNIPDCFYEWKRRCYQSHRKSLWDMLLEKSWDHLLHSCKRDIGALRHYQLQPTEYMDSVIQRESVIKNSWE